MASKQEKWQEIANRGLQDKFDSATRQKFDEAVRRGLITLPESSANEASSMFDQMTEERGSADDSYGQIVSNQASDMVDNVANYPDRVVGRAEALGSMATGIGSTIAGGLGGLVTGTGDLLGVLPDGAGAETVKGYQELALQPQTEAGKKSAEQIQAEMKKIADIFNIPVSGYAGIIELLADQSIEQVVETIRNVQEQGAGVTAGDRVLEETGSPAAATLARIAPEAAANLALFKGAPIPADAATVGEALNSAASAVKGVVPTTKAMMRKQSPERQEMAIRIKAGDPDGTLAAYKLDDSPIPGVENVPDSIRNMTGADIPRSIPDKTAEAAIYQGLPEKVVTPLKLANPRTKAEMRNMLKTGMRASTDGKFGMEHTTGEHAGDAVMDIFNVVKQVNKNAGKSMEGVLKDLKNSTIDVSVPVDNFIANLNKMDIRIGDKNKLDESGNKQIPGKLYFKGSDIEGMDDVSKNTQKIIQSTFTRMWDTNVKSAYDVHKLKKFIDNKVTFGKTPTGFPGEADRLLKSLRSDVNNAMKGKFSEYDRVNTTYSETITALDAIRDHARKLDESGEFASLEMGNLLRVLLSNRNSRARMRGAMKGLRSVAGKYTPKAKGGDVVEFGVKSNPLDLDIDMLVLMADALENLLGTSGGASLQGILNKKFEGLESSIDAAGAMSTGSPAGMAGAGVKIAKGMSNKLETPKNNEEAFKAIMKLLKEGEVI